MADNHLLNCPFCGGESVSDFIEDVSYIIECHACGCRTSMCNSKSEAIETWNRRAVSAPTAERQSIGEDPEFRMLLQADRSWQSDETVERLIAHIDTWAARRDGEAVPAVVREALDIALDLAVAEAENVHITYAGYKPHKHIAVDQDVATIRRAIEAIRAAPAPGNTVPVQFETMDYDQLAKLGRQQGK